MSMDPASISRFATSVSAVSPTFDLLYGTHICDLHLARTAMEEGRLRPMHCEVFDEKLIYIFYGKPAYRPKSTTAGKRFLAGCPVCFVVELASTAAWRRVYPFDTGGFPDRYSQFFNENMTLADFQMPATPDSARRVVEAFFASNTDYYDSKPMIEFRARKTLEASVYHELLKAYGSGQNVGGDDRLAAIEIQICDDLALDSGRIHRIIIPDRALELADITEALGHCGIPFETYVTGSLGVPEYYGRIYDHVRDLNRLGTCV